MGNTNSTSYAGQNLGYFCVVIRSSDSLSIIGCDDDTFSLIKSMVNKHWPRGVELVNEHDVDVKEIKLVGEPFIENGNSLLPTFIWYFCCKLLAALQRHSWQLFLKTNLSRYDNLSTLFFRRNSSLPQAPVAPLFVALVLGGDDQLQLIHAPSELREKLIDVAKPWCQWLPPSSASANGGVELRLRDQPWSSNDCRQTIQARLLLLAIIRSFDAEGYTLSAMNLKGTTDTILFTPDFYMVPGEAVYWILSLNGDDRIRLVDAPRRAVDCVRDVIASRKGIKSQRRNDELHYDEFKLIGRPWNCDGDEATKARLMMTLILEKLHAIGWIAHCGLNVNRDVGSTDVLLMKKCQSSNIPYFCISANGLNKLRVINCPEEIREVIDDIIETNWPNGIQSVSREVSKWKLIGAPWGDDYAHASLMMMNILKEINSRGWQVVCSLDMSSKFITIEDASCSIGCHCWFVALTGEVATNSAQRISSLENQYEDSSNGLTSFCNSAVLPSVPYRSTPPTVSSSDAPPSYDEVMGTSRLFNK